MAIKQITPQSVIEKYLRDEIGIKIQLLIRNLQYVGEQCVNTARSNDLYIGRIYIDRTGNLRSSIDYVIANDGKIVAEGGFNAVRGGSEGSAEGREYARRLAREFPNGIVLLVVAGMNYAKYVSNRGYDVLDSAELLADRLVPQILKQLGFKRG